MTWQPKPEGMEVLARGIELIKSVPYKVSLRWVFYRLLQEGYYYRKGDYTKLKYITAKARKEFYGGWYPGTLADETRKAYQKGLGYLTPEGWLRALPKGLSCYLDKNLTRTHYVELWYEARAMHEQFGHYTDGVTLMPFGGDPSISLKWETAKRLEDARRRYEKPITILYFGDLDDKGVSIPRSAARDIWLWSEAEFEFKWCGLTEEQALEYDVPENPDKPGQYQWEALSDYGAKEIIVAALQPFVDDDLHDNLIELEDEAESLARAQLEGIVGKWKELHDA